MTRTGLIGQALERGGVIDRHRLATTWGLAWPRILTGVAIMSKTTVDLAFIGIAVGTPAVAGFAFANAYWQIAKFVGIGLAGGVVALISQAYGAEAYDRGARILAHGLAVAVLLAVPIAVVYGVFASSLVAVFDPSPAAAGHAETYLVLVAPAVVFEFLNLIGSRTYAGVGDTGTPMVIRAVGAFLNIGLSAGLIFGAGLGVAGAAIGTTVAVGAVTVVFAWGLGGRAYPRVGRLVVALKPTAVTFDRAVSRELLTVSAPLIARGVAEAAVSFPLLWIAGSFNATVVAAYEVARRVRSLVDSLSWGFSIAASTLVGQHLGAGDLGEADAYAWGIIRLSAVVYVVTGAVVAAAAAPIAGIFVGPDAVATTRWFVVAAAVSVVFLGVDGSATGTLRGAGDTTYPFFTSLLGRYGGGLTVAAIGLSPMVGPVSLVVALVVETLIPASLNVRRVQSGRWKTVGGTTGMGAEVT